MCLRVSEESLRQARFGHLAVGDDHEPGRHTDNTFLMGDKDQTFFLLLVNLFKLLDQHRKAPEVNAGFRFIKNAKRMLFGKNRCNFDTFHFTAGKGSVCFSVNILLGTETDSAEKSAAFALAEGSSCFKIQKAADGHAFKTRRLLESESDASLGTFIDGEVCNVFSV